MKPTTITSYICTPHSMVCVWFKTTNNSWYLWWLLWAFHVQQLSK